MILFIQFLRINSSGLSIVIIIFSKSKEKTISDSQKQNRPSFDLPKKSCCCRERGARALEERLATERLVPSRNKDELQSDALDSV